MLFIGAHYVGWVRRRPDGRWEANWRTSADRFDWAHLTSAERFFGSMEEAGSAVVTNCWHPPAD